MKSLSFGGCYRKTKREENKRNYFYERMDRLYLKIGRNVCMRDENSLANRNRNKRMNLSIYRESKNIRFLLFCFFSVLIRFFIVLFSIIFFFISRFMEFVKVMALKLIIFKLISEEG